MRPQEGAGGAGVQAAGAAAAVLEQAPTERWVGIGRSVDEHRTQEQVGALSRHDDHAVAADVAEARLGRPGALHQRTGVDAPEAAHPLASQRGAQLAKPLGHEVVVVTAPGVARDLAREATRV